MIATVLKAYGFDRSNCTVMPFGSGLINSTWKIAKDDSFYILQRINHNIFKQPQYIADNIRNVTSYLHQHFPGYLFVAPVTTLSGEDMVIAGNQDYYRLFPFVQRSHTIDVVTTPQQAYEAAKQFGAFAKKLSGFDVSELAITLPDFHNLTLRYQQLELALKNGNHERLNIAKAVIDQVQHFKFIADEFEKIKKDPEFKIRVMHHDTKISNVLFDENYKGLCVIDPDTIMPGYFISDVGDMLRTYLSPANEEEKDFSKIEIRKDYLEAIKNGYLEEMGDELTGKEKEAFIYAGKFMIYMQAIRFLTDFLNNDVYYGEKYPDHNLVRAQNQMVLLEKLSEVDTFRQQ